MSKVLEFPEANVEAWLAFSRGLRDWFPDCPEYEYDIAMQDTRAIFMSAYHSGNFKVSATDIEGALRVIDVKITNLVAPLLIEIVRLKLELRRYQGDRNA